jgi:serpin B
MKPFFLFICVCAVLLPACRDNGTGVQPAPRPIVRDLTTLEKGVVSSDNSFGLKLFVRINSAQQNKNVFISPFSVSMALGMALNGAHGGTLDSMKKALEHSDFTTQEINESYKSISSLLISLDPNVAFSIANSVWSRSTFEVLPAFLDNCRTYFDAEVASLDFSSPAALQTINGWVNSNTNGKIPTILDEIPPDAVLYLINAIYFKGTWTYQFDPAKTTDETFTSSTGSTSSCRMMTQKARYAYGATAEAQIIDLPYGNGSFSMTVILPKSGTSIDQFVADLTPQQWGTLVSNLDSTEVDLFMPKLKMEYERTLNDDLTAMGMGIAFSEYADFSGISHTPVLITEVLHKTFVEVNEEGTEAAAVTSVGFGTVSVPSTPTMRIDHSFVFAIREHATGTILFIGKIVFPEGA